MPTLSQKATTQILTINRNSKKLTRIVLDAIPRDPSVTNALHRITRTPVLGQRLPPVKLLTMVRVETSSSSLGETPFTAGTPTALTRPGHATASTGATIALPTAALGPTERVEEAGLVLGTTAAGQLLVLVRRDVARLGGHELRIAANGAGGGERRV